MANNLASTVNDFISSQFPVLTAVRLINSGSNNNVVNNASSATSVLSDVLAMDANNVANRNALQSSWLNQVMEYNSAESVKNRDFQARENAINRQLQTELSNSAYSRAIADLKSQGINPYFALTKGLSASTPTFSSASGSAASVSSPNALSQNDIMSSYASIFNNLVNNAFNNRSLGFNNSMELSKIFLKVLK